MKNGLYLSTCVLLAFAVSLLDREVTGSGNLLSASATTSSTGSTGSGDDAATGKRAVPSARETPVPGNRERTTGTTQSTAGAASTASTADPARGTNRADHSDDAPVRKKSRKNRDTKNGENAPRDNADK